MNSSSVKRSLSYPTSRRLRNRITCVLTRENYQIVFVDTPGIHKQRTSLGEYMVRAAQNSLGYGGDFSLLWMQRMESAMEIE